MHEQDYKKYFEILEIKADTTFLEVKEAYSHLKTLYLSKSSIFTPIEGTSEKKKRKKILEQIEEAYSILSDYYLSEKKQKTQTIKTTVSNEHIPEFDTYDGNALRLTREVLKINLEEIAFFSKIPLKYLKNIELERFDLLPPKAYVRIFIRKYAEYLSLDINKVTNDYMKKYENKNENEF